MSPQAKITERDFLFWSGGKDACLALLYHRDKTGSEPILVTTFDEQTQQVPHQKIPVARIRQQAIDLGLMLYTIPLSYPASNHEYLSAIQQNLKQLPFSVNTLIFGDLHLQDIRDWREKEFGAMGYDLLFPIWQKPYDELFDRLERDNITIRISAVMNEFSDLIQPGQIFNRAFAESLPEEIDKMGENGEFHTEITVL